MTDTILALNCGSSSIKFAGFDQHQSALFRGQVEPIGAGHPPQLRVQGLPSKSLPPVLDSHETIIPHLLDHVISTPLAAVGHRVVHGGTLFHEPVRITPEIRADIASLTPLAPSHQPHNLAGMDAVSAALPDLPQVACFDTAFHRSIPEHRQLMPLPRKYADMGLRRFGFHGLSYQRIVQQLPDILGARSDGNIVICHLGNGCSLAGVTGRQSVYTSMGFTPLDGLVMGRRPGRMDPGAVLWLVDHHGGDTSVVARLLNRESGLQGVSGTSSDMRILLAEDSASAQLAITMFTDRLTQEIAAAGAALGGMDALIFTGGIGENAAIIRARTVQSLAWLGFKLDDARNAVHADTITTGTSATSAHVIPTDEEAVIAAATLNLVL